VVIVDGTQVGWVVGTTIGEMIKVVGIETTTIVGIVEGTEVDGIITTVVWCGTVWYVIDDGTRDFGTITGDEMYVEMIIGWVGVTGTVTDEMNFGGTVTITVVGTEVGTLVLLMIATSVVETGTI